MLQMPDQVTFVVIFTLYTFLGHLSVNTVQSEEIAQNFKLGTT